VSYLVAAYGFAALLIGGFLGYSLVQLRQR
jgi:hypothetical protein